MQAVSDIFLGWDRTQGIDGITRDFYVRQLWDWKISANLETMAPQALLVYAHMCGWTLARAHARSGDRIAIGAYLGGSDAFDQALAGFATAYADQNERDHQALFQAVSGGHHQFGCHRAHPQQYRVTWAPGVGEDVPELVGRGRDHGYMALAASHGCRVWGCPDARVSDRCRMKVIADGK